MTQEIEINTKVVFKLWTPYSQRDEWNKMAKCLSNLWKLKWLNFKSNLIGFLISTNKKMKNQ